MTIDLNTLSDADRATLDRVVASGEGAPSMDERLALGRTFCGRSRERQSLFDHFLIQQVVERTHGLLRARDLQHQFRDKLEALLAPPWYPAVVVRAVGGPGERVRALVSHGGDQRVVNLADGVDASCLSPGLGVLLGHERDLIVGLSPEQVPPCGETALFDRHTADGRLVLKWRDETVVARAAASLAGVALKSGDVVRWDRSLSFVFERVERPSAASLFLEEMPAVTFADIGGLEAQIVQLKRCIGLYLFHPEVTGRYRLRRRGSVLLVGYPGNGKTMLARAFCNWLGQQSRSGRARFINIKPAALHSSWYAQSEANYREAFRLAREAGAAEPEVPVVLFFDEVDSVGVARGQRGGAIDDRVQTAFMAELDSLEERGNVLVVAATNRRSALDPALLRPGRLGDLIVEVPRPNRAAARDIFTRGLGADLPYAGASADNGDARERILDGVVSALYAPNGEGAVATLRFRDGRRRAVRVADLISGADIMQICGAAVERACVRQIEIGDERGVRLDDLLGAAGEQMAEAARGLSPLNCRSYIPDLPDDCDVVGVDTPPRRVERPHRYRTAA